MRSILHPGDREAILRRLARLGPDDARRWGRMTAHQVVVHLTDSLRLAFGERGSDTTFRVPLRRLTRFVAFTLPLPWPRGIRTVPEVDPERAGSPAGVFEEDVAGLRAWIDRVVEAGGVLPPHPVWGELGSAETGRYVWRHLDHHLRQFGR